ncbi:hypothetical protein [Dasania marina]|uniref:hypothetical protein n=1 Tax=Dasania marina TaxID=471499 RepID=UPI00037F2895|nr:hypothetical protein [Dasania marina]
MTRDTNIKIKAIVLLPVVGVTAFLFHFVWEMWQAPFYQGMSESSHWSSVILCSRASLGDAFIAMFAYLLVAWVSRNFAWIYKMKMGWCRIYIAIGLVITLILEYLATEVFDRWQYSEIMPQLWGLGTGITPIIQWLIVPLVSLWAARIFCLGLNRRK